MKISDNKSILLSLDRENDVVKYISQHFPYQLKDLNEGIKYLGYLLNPNNYRIPKWK